MLPWSPAILWSVTIQAIWVGGQFGATVILVRLLDPSSFGIYTFAWTLCMFLQFLPTSGFAVAIVRFSATYVTTGANALLAGLWRRYLLSALIYGGTTASVLALPAVLGWQSDIAVISPPVLLAMSPALVLFPVLAVIGATLRGIRPGILGQLPEYAIRPLAILILLLVPLTGYIATPGPAAVMLLQGLSILIAVVLGLVLLARHTTIFSLSAAAPRQEVATWSSATYRLSIIGVLWVLNSQTDVLMLGWFHPPEEVAHYRIAFQGAILVMVPLTAANLLLAPRMASLFASNDLLNMQRLLFLSARLTFLVGAICTAIYAVFGDRMLDVVFGPDYAVAYPMLLILSLGQLMNLACGSVGTALGMIGYESGMLRAVAAGAVGNVTLNLMLVPAFGGIGAAMAAATSMAVMNILMVILLRRRTGISAFLFKLPTRRSR